MITSPFPIFFSPKAKVANSFLTTPQTPAPKWQDLSKPTQWALVAYQTAKLQPYDQGLPDAFHTLRLRLGDILAFAETYRHDKARYDQWRARIRATDPSRNDLAFYHRADAWTNMDLVAYFVSGRDVRQGRRYLRHVVGEAAADVDDLEGYRGRRAEFFTIPGMDELDVAFLRDAALRGVDTEYGDLTRESIDWLLSSYPHDFSSSSFSSSNKKAAPRATTATYHQQDKPFQPRTPESLKQDVKKFPTTSNNNMDGAASEDDDNDDDDDNEIVELTSPFDRNFPYIAHEPFYYSQYSNSNSNSTQQAVSARHTPPVGSSPQQERLRPVVTPGRPRDRLDGGVVQQSSDSVLDATWDPAGSSDPSGPSSPIFRWSPRPTARDGAAEQGEGGHSPSVRGAPDPQDESQPHPQPSSYDHGPKDPEQQQEQQQQEMAGDYDELRSRILQLRMLRGHRNVGPEGPSEHLGGNSTDHIFVGDNGPYQEGEGPGGFFADQPMDVDAPFPFDGALIAPAPGEDGVMYPEAAGYIPDPQQASQALADAILGPENLAVLEEQYGSGPIGPHDYNMQSPQQGGQPSFLLQDAPVIRDSRTDSVYQGPQDVTGFPPPPLLSGGLCDDVAGASLAPSASCSHYENRVRDFEGELRDSTDANSGVFHRAHNNQHVFMNPVDSNVGLAPRLHHYNGSSLPPHLAFNREWYASQQPAVHSFPRYPVPGWGRPPMWGPDPMLAQDTQVYGNEGGVLASFVPGHPAPNALIDPRLLDARTSYNNGMMGSVPPVLGQPQLAPPPSQTTRANVPNTPAAPGVGRSSSSNNNVLVLSPVPGDDERTPTQGQRQASQSSITTAAAAAAARATPTRSSATKGAVRLSLVETPSGQAVLQQEPVVNKNKPSTPPPPPPPPHSNPKKRALEADEPVVVVAATPARPRGGRRPHRKETCSLESDEDFNGVGVPICESDDDDWVEPKKRRYSGRKGKKAGEAAKGKKPSGAETPQGKKPSQATPRRKKPGEASKGKKAGDAAPKEKKPVETPKPKYTRRKKKTDADSNGAPPAPGPVSAVAGPEEAAAPLLTHPRPHAAILGVAPGVNNPSVPSGAWPPAAMSSSAGSDELPTPPVSNDFSALVTPGLTEFGHHPNGSAPAVTSGTVANNNTTGEGHALVSELPNQKPKRKTPRRPQDPKDETATKPKRARTKKTDATSKKDTRAAPPPPAGRKETPVPLPPMPFMCPGQQQGGSSGNDNNSASPQPATVSSGPEAAPMASTQRPCAAQQEDRTSSALAHKGSYRNRISAEEFDAMSSRGEMLSFGQPQQTGGPVAAATPHSGEPYFVMVPALSGIPIIPQTCYPRPEPTSSLADAFTGVYAASTAVRPAAPGTTSPTQRSSTAHDDAAGENAVARNIQEAQKKIRASVKTAQSGFPGAQPVAPTATDAQPCVPRTESFFAPIRSNTGSPTQPHPQPTPTPTQEKAQPSRKNSIDPKTGRPRVGRPRTRTPKDSSPKSPEEQPQTEQTEQAGITHDDVVDQGVNTPADEP